MKVRVTSRAFGLEIAYLTCDRMKEHAGCGICGNMHKRHAELTWWSNKKQRTIDNDAFILTPFRDALKAHSVICWDCIQQLRKVHIPPIQRIHDGLESSK